MALLDCLPMLVLVEDLLSRRTTACKLAAETSDGMVAVILTFVLYCVLYKTQTATLNVLNLYKFLFLASANLCLSKFDPMEQRCPPNARRLHGKGNTVLGLLVSIRTPPNI
jgi:hypothetical protein